MSNHTANLAVSRLASLALVLLAPRTAERRLSHDEFTFAAGLVEWGLPDWLFKVLDAVEREHPDQAGRVKVVRAEGLLAQRKLAEVETTPKGMKPDDPKADAIRLATANYYYRIGDVPKAKELYNAFFGRFKTVPTDPDLLRNYLDSSYRFAKMLEMAGDLPGTAAAYERLISAKPEREVLRRWSPTSPNCNCVRRAPSRMPARRPRCWTRPGSSARPSSGAGPTSGSASPS